MKNKPTKDELSRVAAFLGRAGGLAKTKAQEQHRREMGSKNRRYKPCSVPAPSRRSAAHRFNKAGVCHGCKKTRDELRVRQ